MNWSFVSLAQVPPQPWRNGGGVTRELLAWPGDGPWRVRLSVADIEAAGPFSKFEGIERWFAVLEGAGVDLQVQGRNHRLGPGDGPFCFDGSAEVACTLPGGPTRDFNLMATPGKPRMRRAGPALRVGVEAGTLVAVYPHATAATLESGGRTLAIPPAHLAWSVCEEPFSGRLRGEGTLWIEARP